MRVFKAGKLIHRWHAIALASATPIRDGHSKKLSIRRAPSASLKLASHGFYCCYVAASRACRSALPRCAGPGETSRGLPYVGGYLGPSRAGLKT